MASLIGNRVVYATKNGGGSNTNYLNLFILFWLRIRGDTVEDSSGY